MSEAEDATFIHFKYVFVPWDTDKEIQELDLELPKDKEVIGFLDHLKEHFASGKPKSAKQKQAQKQALLATLGKDAASSVTDDVLSAAADMQMVENIALLSNAPDTGFVAVNMYCDDSAALKDSPRNVRASAIASTCGRPLDVRGDVFLARVFDNEDDFKRMDFTLAEVSSDAQWVAAALAQNRRRQAAESAESVMARLERSRSDKQHARGTGAQGAAAGTKPAVAALSPAEKEKESGNAAFRSGDWELAAGRYTAALKLDPALLVARNNRAMTFLKLGRYEEAAEDAAAVLVDQPGNVKALLRRGAAREALGHIEEAKADFQEALRLEPANQEAAAGAARLAQPAALMAD